MIDKEELNKRDKIISISIGCLCFIVFLTTPLAFVLIEIAYIINLNEFATSLLLSICVAIIFYIIKKQSNIHKKMRSKKDNID